MLRNLSKRLARREGGTPQRVVLRRLQARVATEIMCTAARMAIRCRPRPPDLDDEAEDGHAPTAESVISAEADLRAGNPGDARLPSYAAPQNGASVSSN